MTTKQKLVRKKKRISKHVLASKGGQPPPAEEAELGLQETLAASRLGSNDANVNKTKKTKKKKEKNVKDPSEAATYLSAWKYREKGSNWKFNKNTQSWLIRHMYEPDKVSKANFGLLLEYLNGLQGKTRTRVVEDAKRRAYRYKLYEKSQATDQKAEGESAKTVDANPNEVNPDIVKESSEKSKTQARAEAEDDSSRWEKLDSHGKRKQYKRSRKVLEALTVG